MKEKDYNNLFNYLKLAAFIIAGIVGVFLLMSFVVEPFEVKLNCDRAIQDAKDKNEREQREKENTERWVRDVESLWNDDRCGTYDPRDR